MDTIDRILAGLAGPQAGVFTTAQATGRGVSVSALVRRNRRGSIYRIHPATWVVGHDACSMETLRWAAVLAAGPDAMICRMAAAQDWGFVRGSDARPDVVVSVRQRPLVGVGILHSRTLDREDRMHVGGRPTTSPERTIVDLADGHGEAFLCKCLREATVRRLLDLARLRRTMERNRGRRGAGRMRRALARFLEGDGGGDSIRERRFLERLHRAGELSAQGNHELRLNGVIVRPDIWLADDEVAIEMDEWTHGIPQVTREDRLKEALLAAAGIPLIRIDQDDPIGGFEIVIRELATIRRARCTGEPASGSPVHTDRGGPVGNAGGMYE